MPRSGYDNLLQRYRHYAPDYNQKYARYSEGTLSKALELVPDIEGDLLDVACGTGLFERVVRERRPRLRVTGVDISPEMLDTAREHFNGDNQVRFITGTAEALAVVDCAFDIVACNNAFHLVQDATAAMREFHRVLRPGGRIVIVDWCRDAPQMALMSVGLRLTDRQVRRIRTLDGLCAVIEENGFTVTHRERFRVPPMWGLMAVSAIATMPA